MALIEEFVTKVQEVRNIDPNRILIKTVVEGKKHQTDLMKHDGVEWPQFRKEALTQHFKYVISQL